MLFHSRGSVGTAAATSPTCAASGRAGATRRPTAPTPPSPPSPSAATGEATCRRSRRARASRETSTTGRSSCDLQFFNLFRDDTQVTSAKHFRDFGHPLAPLFSVTLTPRRYLCYHPLLGQNSPYHLSADIIKVWPLKVTFVPWYMRSIRALRST